MMPKALPEESEEDFILGDVRWEEEDVANIATFMKTGESVEWTIHGQVNIAGAVSGLVGGVLGAVASLAVAML